MGARVQWLCFCPAPSKSATACLALASCTDILLGRQAPPGMGISPTSFCPLAAGVYGRVTDLANATSKKYNIALAVLLARDMDSVVVKDEAVAKDCIQLLKDRKAPPMTFYPLNSVKVRQQRLCIPSCSRCTPHTVGIKRWTSCRPES